MIENQSVPGQEILQLLVSQTQVEQELGGGTEGLAAFQTLVALDPVRQILAVVLGDVVGFQTLHRLGVSPAFLATKLSLWVWP